MNDVDATQSVPQFQHHDVVEPQHRYPPIKFYMERRVLDTERYELSRRFMPQLAKELGQRQIRFAGTDATNFFIAEDLGPQSAPYAVFFEVKRDRRREQ